MNTQFLRRGAASPETREPRSLVVRRPVATTFEASEGIGGKRLAMASVALLIGLFIVLAETYWDNLRGNSSPSATFGTRGSAD